MDSSLHGHYGVPFSSNLVGFQDDSDVVATHHVFYVGYEPDDWGFTGGFNNKNIYELYASDSGDATWINHAVQTITPQPNNVPIGLTALWDENTSNTPTWNPSPERPQSNVLQRGIWWGNSLNTPPDSYAPLYSMAATNPGMTPNIQFCVGDPVGGAANYGDSAYLSEYMFDGSNWNSSYFEVAYATQGPNLVANSGTLAFWWYDEDYPRRGGDLRFWESTRAYFGCPNGTIYMYVPGVGSTPIATNATTNTAYSPTTNQLAGFYDGYYLNIFYVTNDGYVDRIWMPADNIDDDDLCDGSCWSHQHVSTQDAAY